MHNQPGGAPPVFVDRTGRRRRLTVVGGTAMAVGLLASFGLILAGLFGGSSVPLPGWTEPAARPPIRAGVDGVEELPQPASPTARSRPTQAARTAVPSTGAAPSTVAPAPTAVRPTTTPTAGSGPGRGDERRATKPNRSPGRQR